MSDRTDRKLVEIPVARYAYRHEAEFGAGFLEDAGIPYRLQIDDPALGVPMSGSATLWVTAMDERRARQVLEHEVDASGPTASPTRATDGSRGLSKGDGPPVSLSGKRQSDLTLRQRVLALGGGLGLLGGLAVDAVTRLNPVVLAVIAAIAAALLLIALSGRAPGPVRSALSALSGDAP